MLLHPTTKTSNVTASFAQASASHTKHFIISSLLTVNSLYTVFSLICCIQFFTVLYVCVSAAIALHSIENINHIMIVKQ